jgi:hypothetical protein
VRDISYGIRSGDNTDFVNSGLKTLRNYIDEHWRTDLELSTHLEKSSPTSSKGSMARSPTIPRLSTLPHSELSKACRLPRNRRSEAYSTVAAVSSKVDTRISQGAQRAI